MFKELDLIVLRHDLPAQRLEEGDVGTIVGVYAKGGYEVEFAGSEGDTFAVVTLGSEEIRPMARQEILHVRDVGLGSVAYSAP